MAVTFLIDDHPREPRPYVLRDVADCLRVPRDEIEDVLANWSPDKSSNTYRLSRDRNYCRRLSVVDSSSRDPV